MNADERERLVSHFELGFRELLLRDIRLSDKSDVRMGTFIQCASFVDALALAFSPDGLMPDGRAVPGKKRGIWKRFVETYLPQPKYGPVADAYHGFRSLLLHNFSASETLGFTHGEPSRHLQVEGKRVMLNRGSFVSAVGKAFEKFYGDGRTTCSESGCCAGSTSIRLSGSGCRRSRRLARLMLARLMGWALTRARASRRLLRPCSR